MALSHIIVKLYLLQDCETTLVKDADVGCTTPEVDSTGEWCFRVGDEVDINDGQEQNVVASFGPKGLKRQSQAASVNRQFVPITKTT